MLSRKNAFDNKKKKTILKIIIKKLNQIIKMWMICYYN